MIGPNDGKAREQVSVDENEFFDLPDDPEEAFAVFQAREHERLESARDQSWLHERRYVNSLIASDEVHGLGLLIEFRNAPYPEESFAEFFFEFSHRAEIIYLKIKMEAARRQKPVLNLSSCSTRHRGQPFIT
jgi:hypothetical protein